MVNGYPGSLTDGVIFAQLDVSPPELERLSWWYLDSSIRLMLATAHVHTGKKPFLHLTLIGFEDCGIAGACSHELGDIRELGGGSTVG